MRHFDLTHCELYNDFSAFDTSHREVFHLCGYEIALQIFYFTSRAYFLNIKPLYPILSWQYSNIRICARQYGFL